MSGVPCVAVVGWSGAGKTTLLERLVPLLAARGLRVAVLKHSSHPHPLQRAGSDSARLGAAGARATGFATPEGLQLTLPGDPAALFRALLARAEGLVDLVLVEGWKDAPLPKLEVWREGLDAPLACSRADIGLLVLSGETPAGLPAQLPTLAPDRLDAIADWVQRVGATASL
ncbi:molybdopterin-guanine dinucleotide biosynthesis protein B [Aggregicoccus sp. 17bor-14]|uniref:molybdopterin-guanine dinucleotide biosynthesis protein B n=1 Tax=Myxococcaceae TaxID=31 RepID=UPI00129C35FC|nr:MULTISPECIES: molybdopterin-guanine dinucleotide biosynthesis protein B [Myxococcaceae]MBF5044270.1 molybdopterin-guanine dinucleotide biosynthesis protein B [Simulacricoccus sp. 17bor-14]MRI90020.1 molybdopterin-guanine dinucleotide biosynthesis protein B [Aggregicoccus sp. 17bor-14]